MISPPRLVSLIAVLFRRPSAAWLLWGAMLAATLGAAPAFAHGGAHPEPRSPAIAAPTLPWIMAASSQSQAAQADDRRSMRDPAAASLPAAAPTSSPEIDEDAVEGGAVLVAAPAARRCDGGCCANALTCCSPPLLGTAPALTPPQRQAAALFTPRAVAALPASVDRSSRPPRAFA